MYKSEGNELRWNQGRKGADFFYRRFCPICGEDIPKDNAYGSFEISERCPISGHYTFFMNTFGESIRILGEEFKPEDVDKIEMHLDKVGDIRFKRITETP